MLHWQRAEEWEGLGVDVTWLACVRHTLKVQGRQLGSVHHECYTHDFISEHLPLFSVDNIEKRVNREIFAINNFWPIAQVVKIKCAVQINRYCNLGRWWKLSAWKFNALKISAAKFPNLRYVYTNVWLYAIIGLVARFKALTKWRCSVDASNSRFVFLLDVQLLQVRDHVRVFIFIRVVLHVN